MDKIKKWIMDNTKNAVMGAGLGLMVIAAFMHAGVWAAMFVVGVIVSLSATDND